MRTRDENKIEAIYREAMEMVVNEGFEGLSMHKLAKAAGVSPATIYIYFEDKEDLLVQLHKREVEKFFHYILEEFDPEMDFATGMAVQWKRRAQYVIDYPDRTHFMEHFKFSPLLAKSKSIQDRKFGEVMQQFAEKAIQHKELAAMPFEVYWSVAFAPLYNLVRCHKTGMNLTGERFVLTEEMLMQTLALVLKALKPGADVPVADISGMKGARK